MLSMTREDILARMKDALRVDADSSLRKNGSRDASVAREVVVSISMALAHAEKGVSPLIEALIELGLYSLISLAAEHHHHCACVALADRMIARLGELSPIVRAGNECIACPCGELDESALLRFLDRLLLTIANHPPTVVRLYACGFTGSNANWNQFCNLLKPELEILRVTLVVS